MENRLSVNTVISIMTLIFRKLHRYILLFNMAIWYFLLWLRLSYYAKSPHRYPRMIGLRKIWARCSMFFSGIIFRFTYEEPIDWSRTYIICPNHTSNLDTPMICLLMPHKQYFFMGKAELLDDLVTGIFFRTVDIPVNRNSKISSYKAFKAAKEKLLAGHSAVLFPEGGIANDYPPKLQDFRNGPFKLAIDLQLPILPITSADTWPVLWDDGSKYGSRPGRCTVFVHRPVETAGLVAEDADQLKEKVYNIIEKRLSRMA